MKGLLWTILVIFGTMAWGELWVALVGLRFAGAIVPATGFGLCFLLMWWAVEKNIEL